MEPSKIQRIIAGLLLLLPCLAVGFILTHHFPAGTVLFTIREFFVFLFGSIVVFSIICFFIIGGLYFCNAVYRLIRIVLGKESFDFDNFRGF